MPEPLLQCAAWLDAYFREPSVLKGLPVPVLHHPIFQKGQYRGVWLREPDLIAVSPLPARAVSPQRTEAACATQHRWERPLCTRSKCSC